MDDLVRRAMMGDQQAQAECNNREILLRCPFCGGAAIIEYDTMEPFEYTVLCGDCGVINGTSEDNQVAISEWNRRPALPVGRCKDCIQFKSWGECNETGNDVKPDDFCSYFEPKP